MGVEQDPSRVDSISADELRRLIESRSEDDYLLIDVREPEEYEVGHLPGARLLPVSHLEEDAPSLPPAAQTVLYCHTGVRSRQAANHIIRKLSRDGVYVLDGGLNAWRGHTLEDFPNVHVFDGAGALPDVILRALDLEKGAHRLYEMLCEHFATSRLQPILEELRQAEVAHGRVLFGALKKCSTKELPPFEELFANLTGDIVENGAYLDEMLLVASEMEHDDEASLLELALGVEYMAYDLYRSLSHRVEDAEQKRLFSGLAAQEKGHVSFVLKALAGLAS